MAGAILLSLISPINASLIKCTLAADRELVYTVCEGLGTAYRHHIVCGDSVIISSVLGRHVGWDLLRNRWDELPANTEHLTADTDRLAWQDYVIRARPIHDISKCGVKLKDLGMWKYQFLQQNNVKYRIFSFQLHLTFPSKVKCMLNLQGEGAGCRPCKKVTMAAQSAAGVPGSTSLLFNRIACVENFSGIFEKPAKILAKFLLGEYLYFPESKIVLRILQTEAYPDSDDGYEFNFFKDTFIAKPAGEVVAWNHQIVIKAGKNGESGDVVLLRGCEPVEGIEEIFRRRNIQYTPDDSTATPEARKVTFLTRRDIVIGPKNVAEAFGEEWKTSPLLFQPGGVQMFHSYIPGTVCLDRNEECVITVKRKPGKRGGLYKYGLYTSKAYRHIKELMEQL